MASCEKCFKYHHVTIQPQCSFCLDYSFPENILCDLLRWGKNVSEIECLAFKPNLSIVGDTKRNNETIEYGSENIELSDKHKWLKAYAIQQWDRDSSKIICELNYHLCLIEKGRNRLFSSISDQVKTLSTALGEAGSEFEGKISLLCIGEDHMHIYITSSPDYSGDEVVKKVKHAINSALRSEFSELFLDKNEIFEEAYFIESIG